MVWIPGGGYVTGHSSLPEYDAGLLAGSGAVVATLNYRLGIEGFAQIAGAPANRGLLDQVAALQWVRDNIRVFGGDPDRVTVFGQSAGGGSVAALLAMPRAAGAFRRAIAQSVPGTFFSPELAADIAAACAAELGYGPRCPACRRWPRPGCPPQATRSPPRRTNGGSAGGRSPTGRSCSHRLSTVTSCRPRLGRRWPTAPPGTSDLLVGHTRDEHRLFSLIDGVLGQVTHEQTETALHLLAPGPDGARRYREVFPAAADEALYELVNADWLFRMPSVHLADAQIAGGGRAHLYELTWPAPGMGGSLGACHGLDVPLVFGNLSSGRPAMLIGDPPSPAAEELSAQIRRAWTAFAAHGDPGLASVPRRPPPRTALRHAVAGHRLPGRDLAAAVAGPHLPGPPAASAVAAVSGRPRPSPTPGQAARPLAVRRCWLVSRSPNRTIRAHGPVISRLGKPAPVVW